jgi:hypothetical protein
MLAQFIEAAQMDRSSIPQFSKPLHQPTRLAIVARLVRSDGETLFTDMWSALGIANPGLISRHNQVLENAGLIELRKAFIGKKTATTLVLTALGRQAFVDHMAAMSAMADTSELEVTT